MKPNKCHLCGKKPSVYENLLGGWIASCKRKTRPTIGESEWCHLLKVFAKTEEEVIKEWNKI